MIVKLHHLQNIPDCLKLLLSSTSTAKVGFNCSGDKRRLEDDWGLTVNALVDVHLSSDNSGSLQYACSKYLGKNMLKLDHLRIYHWSRKVIPKAHQMYAITDAYVPLSIKQRRDEGAPLPPPPDPAEAEIPPDSVQKDAFHIIKRYGVSLKHPLVGMFFKELSEAIYVKDLENPKLRTIPKVHV